MRSFSDYENMAMLELRADERALVEKQFVEVVQALSAVDKYDTSGVVPLVSVLDRFNVLREDVVVKHISREELLSNAPEQKDGYFVVPEIMG